MAGAMGGFSLDATDSNNFARLGCQGTYDKYKLDNNNSSYKIIKIPCCQGQFRCPERRVWPMLRPVQGPRRPQSLSVSIV